LEITTYDLPGKEQIMQKLTSSMVELNFTAAKTVKREKKITTVSLPVISCKMYIVSSHYITFLNKGELTLSCRRPHQQIPKDTSPRYMGMT
jgi:hypothetical protein